MKKLIISSLFSVFAGVLLSSCAHDEPVTTQTSTTTRETTVHQPAATQQTTTTRTSGY